MTKRLLILAVAMFGVVASVGSTEANVAGAMATATIVDTHSVSQVVDVRHRHHRHWRHSHHRHWGHRHHRRWSHKHHRRHSYFGHGIRFGHRHHR